MNDIRIDIKVRNNRLISLIEERYSNVSQFCREHDLAPTKVGEFCNLKESPLRKGKKKGLGWREYALKIADALGVLPDELWPEHMQELKLEVNTGFTTVTTDRVQELLGSTHKTDPLLAYQKEETENVVAHALKFLTEREQTVLSLRFGLGGKPPQTLAETGEAIGTSQERVRQIEAKALRKLRHPNRSSLLEGVTEWEHEPIPRRHSPIKWEEEA